METFLENIGWAPVFLSFILSYSLGWLWYSDKMFGQKWRNDIGITVDDNTPMASAMISQAIGTFLLAVIINTASGDGHISHAVLAGFTIAMLVRANAQFRQAGKYVTAVESTYVLAMVGIMVAVNMLM